MDIVFQVYFAAIHGLADLGAKCVRNLRTGDGTIKTALLAYFGGQPDGLLGDQISQRAIIFFSLSNLALAGFLLLLNQLYHTGRSRFRQSARKQVIPGIAVLDFLNSPGWA